MFEHDFRTTYGEGVGEPEHNHEHHEHGEHEEHADHDHGHNHDENAFNYVPSYTNNTQSETNTFGQVVWKRTISPTSFFQLAPYYKYSSIVVTNDPVNDLASSASGSSPIEHAAPSSFAANRHINNLGLKGDYSFRPNEFHLVKTGFQVQVSKTDGYFSIQRDLNTPANSYDATQTGYFQGVYLQDDYRIFKTLILNAGLRYDATQFKFAQDNSADRLLQPRVGLSYFPTETTKLHAFYGKLFQPAAAENLRVVYNAELQKTTSYDIKAEKDDYFEVGVDQQIFGNQIVALNIYYKDIENVLDSAQLLRTSLTQPINYAEGYAYGAEVSLRGQLTQDWSDYATYSYGIAKGKGRSGGIWAGHAPDDSGAYTYLDHVQLHTANAGITYTKNYFWWTVQGLYGSGLRTGYQNRLKLPDHFTMDTTVGYEFHGDSWLSRFKISGDILNIFDNRYPVTIANGFNGSHYAAGRQFFLRITKYL
jgi:outer membrane receptor protein involved in Fe transport